MKTVVYQSYRTKDVPAWLQRCMESVRSWAAVQGYDYRFIDDSLFDRLPPWFRQKAVHLCTQADLARLLLAKEFLSQGYERSIWIDADMLLFAPKLFQPDMTREFSFCHETWLHLRNDGQAAIDRRINNSITIFTKQSLHLDFFIDAALRIAWHREKLDRLAIGTAFLTHLGAALPIQLLMNVGCLSAPVLQALCRHDDTLLTAYARQLPAPLACANLCASLQGQTFNDIRIDEVLLEKAVDTLLDSQGEAINRLFRLGHAQASR